MFNKVILLCGSNGMLAQDFISVAHEKGYKILAADKDDLDITEIAEVRAVLGAQHIDYVLNTAAYTNVDKAEEEVSLAHLINAKGPENLAIACQEKGIPLIQISTDYVFDGEAQTPYNSQSKTNPQSVYGESKLAGEVAVQQNCDKYYILRTSWLYGIHGKNFVETMLSLADKLPELKVVDDQRGCPTWAEDLSRAIISVIESDRDYGVYQACSSGETTWYGFAKKIFELAEKNVKLMPCTSEEFTRPAPRPKYSVMDNDGLIGHWQDGLAKYLKRRMR